MLVILRRGSVMTVRMPQKFLLDMAGKYSAHVRSKDMRRTPGTSRNTQTARKKSTKS